MATHNGTPRISWIGLGNLGSTLASNVVEKGTYTPPALIYNRTKSVAEEFCGERINAAVADSLDDCVKHADIIFLNVSNDDAVEEIIQTGIQAIPTSEQPGAKLFVDLSSIHPNTTDEIAGMIEKAGQDFVACPIFGTPDVAAQGKVVTAIAGPKACVEKVQSFCKGVMGREDILYPDQKPSVATTLKIIGNTFVFHLIEALSEAHVLSEKTGLGSENLHALIEAMYPGPYVMYSNRLMNGDYFKSVKWGAELALKDYGHAKSLAKEAGVELKGLDTAAQHVQDVSDWAKEEKGRKADIAGVYGIVRREAGLDFTTELDVVL